MRYVAKIPFKYERKGEIVEVSSGDEIPDFLEWPYVCQKAHSDHGWVIKEDDPAEILDLASESQKPEERPRKNHKRSR